MEQVNALKEKGNTAFAEGRYKDAIAVYTEAIELDDKNHVLYSNRSAAYLKAGRFADALSDADKTIELQPTWPKGHTRKNEALAALQAKYFQSQRGKFDFNMDVDPQSPTSETSNKSSTKSSKEPKMDAEDANLPPNKRAAKQEKELGNAAYKKKDFENALLHYKKANDSDPTDITFYNNTAAVYFEQKDYDKCIAECEKGIEIGRENKADFKLIAKAFARIGNAYKKLENWKMAKTYYEKSMSEHRTPEIKTWLSDVEKKIKEEERKAYIDPEKAEDEKERGNEFFKKGDYVNAVKHYSEAIRRNPDDPKLYSNRAACYTKLGAFDLGLKDCDMCIKLDEKFIKGYIRKGMILQGMQQPSKALQAYQKALDIDTNNAEALQGYRACSIAIQDNPKEVLKNAASDPEIHQILKDPAMRVILEQMQNDPNAFKEHLKNPEIADKICKLLQSGLIRIQ